MTSSRDLVFKGRLISNVMTALKISCYDDSVLLLCKAVTWRPLETAFGSWDGQDFGGIRRPLVPKVL